MIHIHLRVVLDSSNPSQSATATQALLAWALGSELGENVRSANLSNIWNAIWWCFYALRNHLFLYLFKSLPTQTQCSKHVKLLRYSLICTIHSIIIINITPYLLLFNWFLSLEMLITSKPIILIVSNFWITLHSAPITLQQNSKIASTHLRWSSIWTTTSWLISVVRESPDHFQLLHPNPLQACIKFKSPKIILLPSSY